MLYEITALLTQPRKVCVTPGLSVSKLYSIFTDHFLIKQHQIFWEGCSIHAHLFIQLNSRITYRSIILANWMRIRCTVLACRNLLCWFVKKTGKVDVKLAAHMVSTQDRIYIAHICQMGPHYFVYILGECIYYKVYQVHSYLFQINCQVFVQLNC